MIGHLEELAEPSGDKTRISMSLRIRYTLFFPLCSPWTGKLRTVDSTVGQEMVRTHELTAASIFIRMNIR